MPNTIANIIYGQRFSSDETFTISLKSEAATLWLLPEFKVCSDADVNVLEDIKNILSSGNGAEVFPVLDIDLDWIASGSQEKLSRIVGILGDAGVHTAVLSVDEDNQAIRALSPRFADQSSSDAALSQVSRIIDIMRKDMGGCLVALTVEELCPGGLDPTDGLFLAGRFVESGATGLIGSGGTVDFAPLKYRRQTQQKNEPGREFIDGPETWLASAQWLLGQVDVPVYAQGQVQNFEKSLATARGLGFSGIVATSVKHPSSPLSMAR